MNGLKRVFQIRKDYKELTQWMAAQLNAAQNSQEMRQVLEYLIEKADSLEKLGWGSHSKLYRDCGLLEIKKGDWKGFWGPQVRIPNTLVIANGQVVDLADWTRDALRKMGIE